jgi:hypothetical protein
LVDAPFIFFFLFTGGPFLLTWRTTLSLSLCSNLWSR